MSRKSVGQNVIKKCSARVLARHEGVLLEECQARVSNNDWLFVFRVCEHSGMWFLNFSLMGMPEDNVLPLELARKC